MNSAGSIERRTTLAPTGQLGDGLAPSARKTPHCRPQVFWIGWSPSSPVIALLLAGLPALEAQVPTAAAGLPGPLKEVGFDQRLGESVPLDAVFRDETGHAVRLAEYFGERPVILAPVYYECPMICTMVLNGLTSALRVLSFDTGREFEVVAISFDAREQPALAAEKKRAYLKRYGRPESAPGWHFLTGDEEAIRRLTDSIGFRYVYLPEADQFAHASGLVVVTSAGRIARYFYGVEYSPRDLRLGLVETADQKIGSLLDQALLYCFHYDPAIGKYSAAVMNIVRLGAVATVALLGGFLLVQWRRERRRRPATA